MDQDGLSKIFSCETYCSHLSGEAQACLALRSSAELKTIMDHSVQENAKAYGATDDS